MVKTMYWLNTQKRIEAQKNGDKHGKALYKLMNNAVYKKSNGKLEKKIDVRLVNNEKDCLKCTSKPSYMSHLTFDNNLVAIRKSKIALKLNKPAYTGMCILELSKWLMYEFHHDYIKSRYDNKSKLLFTDAGILIYEIKTEDVYKDFNGDKEMFDFSNYSSKSK